MVLPRNLSEAPGARVPCGLDMHLGPFEPLDELRAWLGTDWFCCRQCRAVVTRANATARRVAA